MRPLLVLAAFASAAAAQTSITWIVNPANGHRYGVGPTTTSWSGGEALAISLGGHLATIRSATEQAWVEANFGGDLGTHGLWIGFNDIAVEGQWEWVSGEPIPYTNWAPGQPDNGSSIPENAAHVYGSLGGPDIWKWNDETETFSTILRPLIELPPAAPAATWASFGAGCLGPAGTIPVLTGVPGAEPRIGTTSRVLVSNLPLTVTIPLFVFGRSDTIDPGPPPYPLPLDLGILGWPGCQQLISDEAYFFEITVTGQVEYPIPLPLNIVLVGQHFFAQVFVLYAPAGVALSNGVDATIGF